MSAMSQQPPPSPWEGHRAPEQGAAETAEAPRRGRPSLLLLAVAAFGVLLVAGIVVLVLLTRDDDAGAPVEELRAGDCLTSADLRAGRESIDSFEVVGCDEEHDAEVFASYELDEETASDFDLATAGTDCVGRLEGEGASLAELGDDELEVRPLVATAEPGAGDRVVCFLRKADGERLSERIVE